MSKQRIPNPFDETLGKTEWTCAALVAQWINEIIKEKNLDLGEALVETKTKNEPERNDVIIRESKGSDKVLCCIEFKAPYYSAFDEKNLKNPARDKANQFKAKYFCTSNFQWLIWYNTARANANEAEERQIHEKYHLSEIENLDLIEESRYKKNIQDALAQFLSVLYEVHTEKKAEPLLPVDAFLIFRLQVTIKNLTKFYRTIIDNKAHKENKFSLSLQQWFFDQGWSFAWQEPDFEKAARQAAYLLVNKILFYDLLQAKRPHDFDPLSIPEDLTKGGLLQSHLEGYFREVLKIDYETIYNTDFIDQVAFPEDKQVVNEIKDLINLLRRYDFSRLGFDVIGGIFEKLIPAEERHILGQYFTNPDVVDLILKFCLKHEDDKVFDPSCGAGTFLVRAYQHKKLMNLRLEHKKILKTLWGTDIAKFPAHLSTINLAINDLSVDENYPQILQEDFFELRLDGRDEFGEGTRKKNLVTVGAKKVVIEYPKIVDCIVGNPPYTRQEEIADISSAETYKEELIRKALYDGNKKIADISKRAGIYAYFFVHGTKFLQNGGRFGFVVSNSWLDVDYGKGIQEFFLKYYKIVAIIESKVERWFTDADINTCIVILERCTDKQQRDENLVRFVYLQKPLRHFIPAAQDLWEKQLNRITEIDKLVKTILAHNEFYQNDELRIYPKKQSELWEEGLETEDVNETEITKYVGSKWGKYLRAPDVFFEIINKSGNKLIKLSDAIDVETYLNTGGADGFYFVRRVSEQGRKSIIVNPSKEGNNTSFKIDSKFLHPFIKSPRDISKIKVEKEELNWYIVIPPEKQNDLSEDIKKYIKWAESKGFQRRSGRMNRNPWWILPPQASNPGKILWSRIHDDSHIVFFNPQSIANTNFYALWPRKINEKIIVVLLNSTFYAFVKEFMGRVNFGGGALKTEGSDLLKFPFPKMEHICRYEKQLLDIYNIMHKRTIGTIFEELGLEKPNKNYSNIDIESISVANVISDRKELDELLICKILGLSKEIILELYKATIDLVLARLSRSTSVNKKKKTKEGIDIDALVKVIMEKVGNETLGTFFKSEIAPHKPLYNKTIPRFTGDVQVVQELFDWYLYLGNKKVKCNSELEARYLKVWAEAGIEQVKIPKDEKALKTIVPKLEKLKASIDKIVQSYLSSILDRKTKEKIAHFVWAELVK